MNRYSLGEIAKLIDGQLIGRPDIAVENILHDSRVSTIPHGSLFLAIAGINHNGNKFVSEMYQKGVRCFLVSDSSLSFSDFKDAGFIVVQDTLNAFQELCAIHRKRFDIPVVGITGSNGKTVVKEWLSTLLEADFRIVKSPRSYNSQIGVPLSVWQMSEDSQIAIFEAGISKPHEMQSIAKIISPTHGVFTNIGSAHQENFTSLKQKTEEKASLFAGCKSVVYCKDQKIVHDVLEGMHRKSNIGSLFSWSMFQDADLVIRMIKTTEKGTEITGEFQGVEIGVMAPFSDTASIENFICCWATILSLELPSIFVKKGAKLLQPVAMRLEMKEGINNCRIINDSYNSDLASLKIALDFMWRQPQLKKHTLILSDILQSGQSADKLYMEVSDLIKDKKQLRFIGIGPSISSCSEIFDDNAIFFPSTDEFLAKVSSMEFSEELILVKGARYFHFERITAFLERKAHNTVLEIDLNSVVHNLNYFRSLLDSGTRIMVMVKAFSYGAGLDEIGSLLEFQKVDYLAVANADEGVVLRDAGIRIPVMVLSSDSSGYDSIIANDMEPVLYCLEDLKTFSSVVKQHGFSSYPVHIEIDTGMHRLGFMERDINDLIDFFKNPGVLEIRSVFSHLAASDEKMNDAFTEQQISSFETITIRIKEELNVEFIRHILNSSGIERFPKAQYDMVRLGIGLYGISVENQSNLQCISSLKTRILQIKSLKKGESIGYSRKGILKRDSRIAILPIGYADGLSRKLSNARGSLYVNGCLAPVMGNVCMDMTMIDVTDCDARVGDEVVVFGKEHPIWNMARQLETIPYEVLTSVSQRVKRLYFHE